MASDGSEKVSSPLYNRRGKLEFEAKTKFGVAPQSHTPPPLVYSHYIRKEIYQQIITLIMEKRHVRMR
ncbi:hypothetical protein SCA6_019518 [Theobroma cacao]